MKHAKLSPVLLAVFAGGFAIAQPRGDTPTARALVEVRADKLAAPVSRLLTGACIEDVNHEIYGGIYSQMVFGESFQESATLPERLRGFRVLGGRWRVRQEELQCHRPVG